MSNNTPGPQALASRVKRLSKYFDLSRIMTRPSSAADIVKYYRKSSLGYALFHSQQGSIHMALSENGQFDPQGYKRAPRLVWDAIQDTLKLPLVLELGFGRGYNLEVISDLAPSTDFHGIDLSPGHERSARKRLKATHNASVSVGDFQSLDFRPQSAGAAFSIESFCHAQNHAVALASVHKVLAPGAPFVVVDAWRTDAIPLGDAELMDALKLTERSMAVSATATQSDWINAAQGAGFEVVHVTPLSNEVLPNLERFEHLAERFMSHSNIAFIAGRILRLRLLENVIAGYLMAESVRAGLHTYDMITLRRN